MSNCFACVCLDVLGRHRVGGGDGIWCATPQGMGCSDCHRQGHVGSDGNLLGLGAWGARVRLESRMRKCKLQ